MNRNSRKHIDRNKHVQEPKFVYRTTLKTKYGLTEKLIKQIGPPDKLVRNPHYKSGPPAQLYDEKRVKAWIARRRREVEKVRERRSRVVPPKECDLLAAIFAVNRAAKRWRDDASKRYEAGNYGLATAARRKKENLYRLKDKGIAAAYEAGRLVPESLHGRLCLYRGEGYCFHSTLVPESLQLRRTDDDKPLMVDAKPKGLAEPIQRDAIATLEAVPDFDACKYTRLEVPRIKERDERVVVCYSCGEEGHLARECPNDDDRYFDDANTKPSVHHLREHKS